MGKWLDNNKLLTVKSNKYDQRLGGEGHIHTINNKEKINNLKRGDEHLQSTSEQRYPKVPQSKMKKRMTTDDKLVKCEKRNLSKQV